MVWKCLSISSQLVSGTLESGWTAWEWRFRPQITSPAHSLILLMNVSYMPLSIDAAGFMMEVPRESEKSLGISGCRVIWSWLWVVLSLNCTLHTSHVQSNDWTTHWLIVSLDALRLLMKDIDDKCAFQLPRKYCFAQSYLNCLNSYSFLYMFWLCMCIFLPLFA